MTKLTEIVEDKYLEPGVALNKATSDLMRPILIHFMGNNRKLHDIILDLYLCIQSKSEPGLCLKNYYHLRNLCDRDKSPYILEDLETFLLANMAVRARNKYSAEIEDFPLNFEMPTAADFICEFRKAYHGISDCDESPQQPEFFFIFR